MALLRKQVCTGARSDMYSVFRGSMYGQVQAWGVETIYSTLRGSYGQLNKLKRLQVVPQT